MNELDGDESAVTVVTPTMNSALHLGAALASLEGAPPGTEHIVVDGGSTDETQAIARASKRSRLIELPGSGIYDALNAGVEHATRPWVFFVNSDDLVSPKAFAAFRSAAAGADIVCGSAHIFSDFGAAQDSVIAVEPPVCGARLSLASVLFSTPIINAMFFRRDLFSRIGGFDSAYRIAADREFLARAALYGVPAARLGVCTYRYRSHEGSTTLSRDPSRAGAYLDEHVKLAAGLAMTFHLKPADRRLVSQFRAYTRAQQARMALAQGRFSCALRAVLLDPGCAVGVISARWYQRKGRRQC